MVEVSGGNLIGLGYTYAGASITALIDTTLAKTINGLDAMDPQAAWRAMQRAVRNLGREGLAATAISAVDAALYDLKARILDLPLATLLGAIAMRSRYTEAVDLPAIRTASLRANSRIGCLATAARSSR